MERPKQVIRDRKQKSSVLLQLQRPMVWSRQNLSPHRWTFGLMRNVRTKCSTTCNSDAKYGNQRESKSSGMRGFSKQAHRLEQQAVDDREVYRLEHQWHLRSSRKARDGKSSGGKSEQSGISITMNHKSPQPRQQSDQRHSETG